MTSSTSNPIHRPHWANTPRSQKTSQSSYGRFTSPYIPTDEINQKILSYRSLFDKQVRIAAALVFPKDRPFKEVPLSELKSVYYGIRQNAHSLFGDIVPYEHMEYIVITEFMKLLVSFTSPEDKDTVMRAFFVGADVLKDARRENISYPLRPWTAFFERFIMDQKDKEWSIGIALFASWTDPEKCQFNRQQMPLIVRAHLSALGMRLAMLDQERPVELMKELISHDSRVLVASAVKGNKSPLTKAKRDLISACHRVLSNISLYRNEEGLAQ